MVKVETPLTTGGKGSCLGKLCTWQHVVVVVDL